jgi:hypothetical protein
VAITFVNTNQNVLTTATSGTTTNVQLRIPSLSDTFAVIAVMTRSNTISVSSVTWQPTGAASGSDQSCFLITAISHGSENLRLEYWGLLNPTLTSGASSSRFIILHSVAGTRFSVGVVLYQGVHQTTPYDGYPSTPTALAQQTGTAIAGTATGNLATTSATGELVIDAIACDVATITDRLDADTGQREYGVKMSSTGTASPSVRGNISTEPGAATVNTAWNFLTTAGAPLAGRSFVQAAFPLKPTTSIAPSFVQPPQTEVAVGQTMNLTTIGVDDTGSFPSLGYFAWGAYPQVPATGRLIKFTGKTATTFTGCTGGVGSAPTGELITQVLTWGNLNATGIAITIPQTAETDDIMIVQAYTEETTDTTYPKPSNAANWAAINTVAGTGFRHGTFYRRIQPGDQGTSHAISISTGAPIQWGHVAAAVYRGCVGAGTGHPGTTPYEATSTNSGTGDPITATGVTTLGADRTVVACFAHFNDATWTNPATMAERTETARATNLSDRQVLTAGATGNFTTDTSVTTVAWTAQLIALIPAAGGATLPRALTRTGTVSETLSRAGSTYHKAQTRTGTVSEAVSRASSIYQRALTRTGTVTPTVARVATLARHLTRTGTVSETLSRAGSTYHKALSYTRSGFNVTVTFVKNVVNMVFRNLTRTGTYSDVVSLAGSTYHKALTRTGTVTPILSRAGSIYSRAVARTGTVSVSLSRAGSTYIRSQSRSGTVAVVVQHTVQGAAVSFFDVGTFGNLVMIDTTKFLNPTFYWEAILKSSDAAQPAYSRLFNVTSSTAVTGSQIQTSANHAVAQRVRSGAISIASGSTYKSQVGKTSGFQATIGYERLIVEVP